MSVDAETTKLIFLLVFTVLEVLIFTDLINGWYNGEPIPILVNMGLQLFCIVVIILVAVYR